MYYLVSGRWFSGSRLHWTVDIRDAEPARGLQENPAVARALARARLGAGHRRGDRSRAAGADPANGTRRQEDGGGAGGCSTRAIRSSSRSEQTTVARAVNTDKDIIKVGDLYYMCFQGVWFMGRSPSGPWEVTGSVPGQIYEIPISSPSYNVTNVTVVEDNSDAVVYATAAAYTGMMIGVGLRRVGQRLLLSAVRRTTAGSIPSTAPTTRRTAITRRTTRGLARTAAVWRRTVRTAAPASARATTRAPAPTRAARPRTDRAAARGVAEAYNPRTGAVGRNDGRVRTCTAAGARPACSAAINGRPRHA